MRKRVLMTFVLIVLAVSLLSYGYVVITISSQTDWNAGQHDNTTVNTTGALRLNKLELNDTNFPATFFSTNLTGLWHLNNDTTDFSGLGNDGTGLAFANCSVSVMGKFNNGCDFRGGYSANNDYIDVPNHNGFNLTQGGAISFWTYIKAKSNPNTDGAWLQKGSTDYRVIWDKNNKFCFGSESDDCITYSFPLAQWVHVVVTFDGGEQAYYYTNGVLRGNRSGTVIGGSSSGMWLGASKDTGNTNKQVVNGYMDDVAIWNRSLTALEIEMLYSYINKNGIYNSSIQNSTSARKVEWRQILTGEEFDYPVGELNDSLPYWSTLPDSLSRLYHFNNDTTDFSGNGNDLRINETARPNMCESNVTGYFDSACSYDGSTDFMTGLSLTNSAGLTVSVWIKTDMTSASYFVDQLSSSCSSGNHLIAMIVNSDGTLLVRITDSGETQTSVSSTSKINTSQWINTVMTFNSTLGSNRLKVYINGVMEGQATATSNALADSSCTLFIGARGLSDFFFDGELDELTIWGRGLSADEVRTIYSGGQQGNITYQVRTCADSTCSASETFVGYDNTADTVFTTDTLNLFNLSLNPYIQFKAIYEALNKSNPSPTLFNFSLIADEIPTVTLDKPFNDTSTGNTSVPFLCNVTDLDSDISNISIYTNTSGTWALNQTDLVDGNTNDTVGNFTLDNVEVGSFVWNCEARTNSSDRVWWADSNFSFAKQISTPLIEIQNPINTTVNVAQMLNFTASSEVTIDRCWYSLDDGATNTTMINCVNVSSIVGEVDGFNALIVWVNTTTGDANRSVVNYTRDSVLPQIWRQAPMNLSYNYTPMLNYTVLDTELDVCWYSLDDGVTNTTLETCQNLSSIGSEGANELIVWVNDTAGNENKSSVNFTIDVTIPAVDVQNPTNTTVGSSRWLNFTVSDNWALDKCWYVLNDTITSLASCANVSLLVGEQEGFNNLRVFVNDSSGNVNISAVNYTLNTSKLEISYEQITIGLTSGEDAVITANISGTFIDKVWVEVNNTDNVKINYTMTDDDNDGQYNLSILRVTKTGKWYFKVFANRTLGILTDNQSWVEFNVTKPSMSSVENYPVLALPNSLVKVSSNATYTDLVRGMRAYLTASGFDFPLGEYPQNKSIGYISAGDSNNTNWYVTVPGEGMHTLNVTYTDMYSNKWSSVFNINSTTTFGHVTGLRVELNDREEVQAGNDYIAEILVYNYNGSFVDPDNISVQIRDPLGLSTDLEYVNMTSDRLAQGRYNYSYTTTGSQTQGWYTTMVSTESSGLSTTERDSWKLIGGPFDVRNITVTDNTVNTLGISVIVENTGDNGQDVFVEWNLTRQDTNEELLSGLDTILVSGNSERTYSINPSTTYQGEVKITFMGYYSGTESAGAYKVFTTTSEPETTTTVSSGGSGGGSGVIVTTTTVKKINDIVVDIDKNVKINLGTFETDVVNVFNNNDKTLTDVELVISGLDETWYEVMNNKMDIAPGQGVQFVVKFLIPDGVDVGDYDFQYIVLSSDGSKKMNSSLSVAKRDSLVLLDKLDYDIEKGFLRIGVMNDDVAGNMIYLNLYSSGISIIPDSFEKMVPANEGAIFESSIKPKAYGEQKIDVIIRIGDEIIDKEINIFVPEKTDYMDYAILFVALVLALIGIEIVVNKRFKFLMTFKRDVCKRKSMKKAYKTEKDIMKKFKRIEKILKRTKKKALKKCWK